MSLSKRIIAPLAELLVDEDPHARNRGIAYFRALKATLKALGASSIIIQQPLSRKPESSPSEQQQYSIDNLLRPLVAPVIPLLSLTFTAAFSDLPLLDFWLLLSQHLATMEWVHLEVIETDDLLPQIQAALTAPLLATRDYRSSRSPI